MKMAPCAFDCTVIFLDKWFTVVPGPKLSKRLENTGPTKKISFTKNSTAEEINKKIKSKFPFVMEKPSVQCQPYWKYDERNNY